MNWNHSNNKILWVLFVLTRWHKTSENKKEWVEPLAFCSGKSKDILWLFIFLCDESRARLASCKYLIYTYIVNEFDSYQIEMICNKIHTKSINLRMSNLLAVKWEEVHTHPQQIMMTGALRRRRGKKVVSKGKS